MQVYETARRRNCARRRERNYLETTRISVNRVGWIATHLFHRLYPGRGHRCASVRGVQVRARERTLQLVTACDDTSAVEAVTAARAKVLSSFPAGASSPVERARFPFFSLAVFSDVSLHRAYFIGHRDRCFLATVVHRNRPPPTSGCVSRVRAETHQRIPRRVLRNKIENIAVVEQRGNFSLRDRRILPVSRSSLSPRTEPPVGVDEAGNTTFAIGRRNFPDEDRTRLE